MRKPWLVVGLMVLLGAACGREEEPEGPAPPARGKLQLAARPAAEVHLDGKPVGVTPLLLDCDAGEHEIVFKAEGFQDFKTRLAVAAGALARLDADLIVRDVADPLVLGRIARQFELELEGLDELERHRGAGDDDDVWAMYPRDTLRPADLSEYRIDVGAAFEGTGTLEFRKGSKVLHSEDFDPEKLSTVKPLPDAVVAAVREKGGTVTWGFYPAKGKPITARFKVRTRDASLSKRLESMEKRLAAQPEAVQHQLRAQVFLNKRYFLAAMREARLAIAKTESAPQAVAILTSVVRRMKLNKTPLWGEVLALADAVPPKARDRFAERERN